MAWQSGPRASLEPPAAERRFANRPTDSDSGLNHSISGLLLQIPWLALDAVGPGCDRVWAQYWAQ